MSCAYWRVNNSEEENWVKDYQKDLFESMFSAIYKTPMSISSTVAFSISFLVGFIGNIFVFVVVAKYKATRTATYTFLVNLAVGDIMVVSICMPMTLASTIYRIWVYGDLPCKLTPFIQGVSVSVSVLTLVLVSVDRYYKIYHPIEARTIFTAARCGVRLQVRGSSA